MRHVQRVVEKPLKQQQAEKKFLFRRDVLLMLLLNPAGDLCRVSDKRNQRYCCENHTNHNLTVCEFLVYVHYSKI
jgi:hypothetical protein